MKGKRPKVKIVIRFRSDRSFRLFLSHTVSSFWTYLIVYLKGGNSRRPVKVFSSSLVVLISKLGNKRVRLMALMSYLLKSLKRVYHCLR